MATREVRGLDVANLALIWANLPKSRLYEVKAFLYSANPVQVPFRNSQIHCAENILGLTRKAALTTAFVAFTPLNLSKRRCYWNNGYPNSIADVDPRDIIDIDEMGLELEHQNRSFGKTVVGDRRNQVEIYNRNTK